MVIDGQGFTLAGSEGTTHATRDRSLRPLFSGTLAAW